MAQGEGSTAGSRSRLVIRNLGLILSGDLTRPILDADTVVAVDGRIASVGRERDVDVGDATGIIDGNGTTLAPGLIDSHVHPVAGDWTPRQNQLGWIDSCLQIRSAAPDAEHGAQHTIPPYNKNNIQAPEVSFSAPRRLSAGCKVILGRDAGRLPDAGQRSPSSPLI
jgi:predicted amidohydrolase YtcJ